jgi:hypothetical protein
LRPLFEIIPAETSGPLVAVRVHGHLSLAEEAQPRCATCGKAMTFRFALIHQPIALDLAPFAAVRVFWCDNLTFQCRPDVADSGANRVLGAVTFEEDAGARKLGALRLAQEDVAALSIDLDAASSDQLAAYDAAREAAPKSKVGGVPVWLQGWQETSNDGAPMELVAQLDGQAWGLSIGDGGAVYVFRSTADPKRYTVLTQSY